MELELGKLSRNNFESTAYPPCLLILLGPPVMDPIPVGKKRENESFAWHRVDSDRLIAKLSIGRGRSRSRSRRPMRMMSEQSLALRSLPGAMVRSSLDLGIEDLWSDLHDVHQPDFDCDFDLDFGSVTRHFCFSSLCGSARRGAC